MELKEFMTMGELKSMEKTQSFHVVAAFTNERYFKGASAALIAYPGEVKIARYKCIESGVEDSIWEFEA
jgi:hypothetical protein